MSAFTVKVSVGIGRILPDEQTEVLVIVALLSNAHARITEVIEASKVVEAEAGKLLASIEGAEFFDVPRIRGGWHPAVTQEIRVPKGAGARHGFKPKKGKI